MKTINLNKMCFMCMIELIGFELLLGRSTAGIHHIDLGYRIRAVLRAVIS